MTLGDLVFLGTWLLSLLAAGLLARYYTGRSSHRPDSPRTWELTLPRGTSFGVSEATAWFRATAPLISRGRSLPVLELQGQGRRLATRLTAPAAWEETLRAQLSAWFIGAGLERVQFDEAASGEVSCTLRFARPDCFPLVDPAASASDPLLGLLGLLTVGEDQCGLRLRWGPPPADWRDWSAAASETLRRGTALPPRHPWLWLWFLLRAMLGPSRMHQPTEGTTTASGQLAQGKLRESVFGAQLQVWAKVEDAETLPAARARVEALASQLETHFHHPDGNRLVRGPLLLRRHPDTSRHGSEPELVCTAGELANLFHLPSGEHSLVPRETSRRVPPRPELLPLLTGGERTWLGEALTREGSVRFGLSPEERRLHTYVVGKTGTGKSTLLATLIRQDLEAGRGVGLIDPHGDLAEQVLAAVPPHRVDEVLYFNAADTEYPVGFNPLAVSAAERRPLVASGVISVFKKLYGESWGPRLEHFLRNTVLALLETPEPSLLLLPRFLTDRGFRARCLTHVRDPLLRTFFLEEFESYDPRWRAEALSPILNKVGQFLASPVVRHLVGQRGAGFDLRELLDRGGIFIANLASGKIGEDNSALLGGLLVAGFQLAAMSRAAQPEGERRDFALCVDEFQHFANDAFSVILSEARKYRLSLTLSHQYLDQVPPAVSDAVFGNVGSLCVFRVGAGDTMRLARELAPTFDAQDLVHLPNHQFCCRVARLTGSMAPFSARTLPPQTGELNLEPLLRRSREQWGRPRAEVELEIADLWEGRMD